MKSFICILAFLFVVTACKQDPADVSYETIVDSSFKCEATINGEQFSFPFHDRTTFSSGTYEDSIFVRANLIYQEEPNNYLARMITISIAKKFKIEDLTYNFLDNGILRSSGDLSHAEFETMFRKGKYSWSYTNCETNNCAKSGGASIDIQYYHGSLFETDYLNKFITANQVKSFYQNADFELTKVTWLAEGVVILEGNLAADIYSFNGELASVTASFKAYCKNVAYPAYL